MDALKQSIQSGGKAPPAKSTKAKKAPAKPRRNAD
ncbi:hypothetical protein ACVWY5_001584 [Bradyrhizobium sp. USDA 3256]